MNIQLEEPISIFYGHLVITNTSFTGNKAEVGGGAIILYNSTELIKGDVYFEKNSATKSGGTCYCSFKFIPNNK